MNRTAVAFASSVISAVGAHKLSIFVDRSPECLQAIQAQLSDALIRTHCGSGFDTVHLIAVSVVGIGVFIIVHFWQDIGSSIFTQEK
jgi:hypothetical protein